MAIVMIYLLFAFGFLRASRNLHTTVLFRLFRAPLSFFDTNPPGRVLNVFSTDMDTVDASLPLDIILWLISVSFLLSAVVTIGYAKPVFLAIIIPLLLINAIAQVRHKSRFISLPSLGSLLQPDCCHDTTSKGRDNSYIDSFIHSFRTFL